MSSESDGKVPLRRTVEEAKEMALQFIKGHPDGFQSDEIEDYNLWYNPVVEGAAYAQFETRLSDQGDPHRDQLDESHGRVKRSLRTQERPSADRYFDRYNEFVAKNDGAISVKGGYLRAYKDLAIRRSQPPPEHSIRSAELLPSP